MFLTVCSQIIVIGSVRLLDLVIICTRRVIL